jgi:hypothetical protein
MNERRKSLCRHRSYPIYKSHHYTVKVRCSANPKSRLKLRSRFFSKTVVHYRIRQDAATIITPPSTSSHLAEAHHARGGEDDHRFAFLALDLRNEWLHPES